MPLKYEPKTLVHILDPQGNTTDLFIRGNATEADILSRLGLPPDQYRLYREGSPLEKGKSLNEQGLAHHTLLEVRGGKVYKRVCRTCGASISGFSPEELQTNVGMHIGETRHKKFSEMKEQSTPGG